MNDCGFCHHPATVHYTRCAIDAGKSTQCRCTQPDFAHDRQDATIAALVEALKAGVGTHGEECHDEHCQFLVNARAALQAAKEGAR